MYCPLSFRPDPNETGRFRLGSGAVAGRDIDCICVKVSRVWRSPDSRIRCERTKGANEEEWSSDVTSEELQRYEKTAGYVSGLAGPFVSELVFAEMRTEVSHCFLSTGNELGQQLSPNSGSIGL